MERRHTIAVVDDDPRVIESLEDLLESAGYAACTFSSARLFLAGGLLGCDALITDIGMPDMDGFELRDAVTRARPGLPVFMITGRHEIADQSRARGISGFFRKPFDGPALLTALGDAVTESKRGGRP